MKYFGDFRSINSDTKYRVIFFDNPSDENTAYNENNRLTLGDNPVRIIRQSNSLFDPIKPSTCTVEIYTESFMPFFYNPTPHGVQVKVVQDPDNLEYVLFRGFVTPCMYTQGYTYSDTVSIECVDALSTLQYFNYSNANGSSSQNVTMFSILKRAFALAGYKGSFLWMNSLTPNIKGIYVNEGNFFDDDELKTPWSWLDVVEEICKFLGWSCIPNGDSIYLNDYRYLAKITQTGSTPFQYNVSSINSSTESSTTAWGYNNNWSKASGNLPYAAGSPALSLEEVYNRIEISANTYSIDKIIPKVDDTNAHISINREQNDFDYVSGSSVSNSYRYWFKKKEKYAGMPGFWSSYCRLDEEKNWKHHFYNIRNCSEITTGDYRYKYDNYRDPRAGVLTSQYQNTPANRMINTVCAIPCHYSFSDTNASSISWNDCLMVLKYNDLCGIGTRAQFKSRENTLAQLPLLTYENEDSLILKPESGTTYITIKCDIFFQRNQRIAESGSGNYSYFDVVNASDKVYATVPFDGDTKIGERTFEPDYLLEFSESYGTYRDSAASGWTPGLELVPMKVRVGNKWWNGSSWQPTECIFYLKHTNDPDKNGEELKDRAETVQTLKWMKLVGTTTYMDKVGEEAYAIPIAATDIDAPSGGSIKIELCTPRYLPEAWHDLWPSLNPRHEAYDYSWTEMGPCMYIKGFACNIVYADTKIWWLDNQDTEDDIVYSHKINDTYCHTFDALELKINTSVEDKPISKSYISDGDSYLKKIKHYFGDAYKIQEQNLIDMYYEHYSKPCKRYTIYANTKPNPFTRYTFGDTPSGTFVLDTQNLDLRNEVNEMTVTEYQSDL